MNFEIIDVLVVATYFIFIFIVGFYFSGSKQSSQNYFLAGRHVGWVVLGTSMFATNISSEHFVGLTATAYIDGIRNANFEFFGALSCLLLAWVFGPIYLQSNVFTMPEFIERRYNSFCRVYLSVVSIVAYILTKISVILLAGGIFLEKVAGLDIYTSSIVLVIATGIYAISGGLTSVTYTGAVQAIILVSGALMVTYYTFEEIGGIQTGVQTLVNLVPDEDWKLVEGISDPHFPWTGVILGIPVITIWYHCTDQFMVHKYLTGKNITESQSGTILTAYLKLIPFFLIMIPGLIAKFLFPNILPDDAFPTMVTSFLPVGIKGLVIAAFLAALMSSLASCFTSCATLFTLDIYKKIYPNANDFVLVNVGRIMTFVIVILSIIWVIFIKSLKGELFIYLQSVSAYIAPPITAIFIMGIAWPRANEKSAVTALVAGFLIGTTRFITEILIKKGVITSGILIKLGSINFLHYASLLFLICIVLMIVVSLLTEKPPLKKVESLTLKYSKANNSGYDVYFEESKTLKRVNIVATIVFVAIIVGLYILLN